MTILACHPLPIRGRTASGTLVIGTDAETSDAVRSCLQSCGRPVVVVRTVAAAVVAPGLRTSDHPSGHDLAFLILSPGADPYWEGLRQLLADDPARDVVVVAPTAELAIAGVRQGATDALIAPPSPAAVELLLHRVAHRDRSPPPPPPATRDGGLVDTPALQEVVALARRAAASTAPILIVGEAGTGKVELARLIHGWSRRAAGPLVIADASPDADAMEADLFGTASVAGRVADAAGGTLVLDRIDETPLPLQPRVRRLIAEQQYEARDDVRPRAANVRLVATATSDLADRVRAGQFREPLRLALDVVRVDLPPLRARPADVTVLAERCRARAARRYGRPVTGFAPAAMAVLAGHDWPGNSAELAAVVERAVVVARGTSVEVGDLPADLRAGADGQAVHAPGDLVPLRTIEDQHIRGVLRAVGSTRAAADVLDIDPSTIWRRLRATGPAGR